MSPGERFGQDAEIIILEPVDPWRYGLTPAAPVCKYFGCGRELTLRERLFGDKCGEHNHLKAIVSKPVEKST